MCVTATATLCTAESTSFFYVCSIAVIADDGCSCASMATAGRLAHLAGAGLPQPCTLPQADQMYRRKSLDILLGSGPLGFNITSGSFTHAASPLTSAVPEDHAMSVERGVITSLGSFSNKHPSPATALLKSGGMSNSFRKVLIGQNPTSPPPPEHKHAVQEMLLIKVSHHLLPDYILNIASTTVSNFPSSITGQKRC